MARSQAKETSRYASPRNLTRWNEDMLTKVVAMMWRGHRAGSYHFDINRFARDLGCTPGGLEQMLDRKHKLVFGAGGPVRGAYKTKKPLSQSNVNIERYEEGDDEYGRDDMASICGYRVPASPKSAVKRVTRGGVMQKRKSVPATHAVEEDDDDDYVDESQNSHQANAKSVNTKTEISVDDGVTDAPQYPVSPLYAGSNTLTGLPYHSFQQQMALGQNMASMYNQGGISYPNTPVMQQQAFQYPYGYHQYGMWNQPNQLYGHQSYGPQIYGNSWGQQGLTMAQQNAHSQSDDVFGVGSQFDQPNQVQDVDPALPVNNASPVNPETVTLPVANSQAADNNGFDGKDTVQVLRSAKKQKRTTPHKRQASLKMRQASPFNRPSIPGQYLNKFSVKQALPVYDYQAQATAHFNAVAGSQALQDVNRTVDPTQLSQSSTHASSSEINGFVKVPESSQFYPQAPANEYLSASARVQGDLGGELHVNTPNLFDTFEAAEATKDNESQGVDDSSYYFQIGSLCNDQDNNEWKMF